MYFFLLLFEVVKLDGGGSIINGAYPSRLLTEPPEAGDKIKGQMIILEEQGTILEIFQCAPLNRGNYWILS